MRPKWLLAGGFALLTLPLLAPAQGQNAPKSPPGYVVIRVSLAGASGGPAAAGPGGGEGGQGEPFGDGGGGQPPPGGPPGGGIGGPPGAARPADDASRSVVVVVPYTRLERNQRVYQKMQPSLQNPPVFNKLVGPAGTAYLYSDNTVTVDYLQQGFYLPAIIQAEHTNWAREKEGGAGLSLVEKALAYGLADKAYQIAGELADVVGRRKEPPKPTVGAFAKAFASFKGNLVKPLPANPQAGEWQSRLGATTILESPHFSLVTFGEGSLPKEAAERRLAALESNFKAFYLWHTLGGEGLPLPDKKLVAVVADKGSDMLKLQAALDGNPSAESISDAFYSPTHNLLVLSPERRDEIGRAWTNFVQKYYQKGYNRDDLLKGNPPAPKAVEGALDVAQVMTMALVDKQVDEEAVTAMVTREGSRQLFATANKLNPYVILPEWVEQGANNLLNKPKGPYFHTLDGKTRMTLGVTSGYGSPNYVLVREFVKMQQAGELNPKPEELLMNVLLDKYFDAVRDGRDIDPPPVPVGGGGGQAVGGAGTGGNLPQGGGFGSGGGPGGRGGRPGGGGAPGGFGEGEMGGGMQPSGPLGGQQPADQREQERKLKTKLQLKSQATSWGLTYFLAKSKTAALLKFFDALSRMPRDMRLDKQLVLMEFCREFDLLDRKDSSRIDQAEFKQFASSWLEFMKNYTNYGLEREIASPAPGSGAGGMGGQPGGAGMGSGGRN